MKLESVKEQAARDSDNLRTCPTLVGPTPIGSFASLQLHSKHAMFAYKIGGPSLRCACYASQPPAISVFRPTVSRLRYLSQQRAQYAQLRSEAPRPNNEQPPIPEEVLRQAVDDASDDTYTQFPKVKVRYLIPAIWALSVSGGIFYGLAYLEAKSELKSKPASGGGWLQAPQWSTKQRGPPTPTEVVTGAWTNLDPISSTLR